MEGEDSTIHHPVKTKKEETCEMGKGQTKASASKDGPA